jgi:hypothetical protein
MILCTRSRGTNDKRQVSLGYGSGSVFDDWDDHDGFVGQQYWAIGVIAGIPGCAFLTALAVAGKK